MGFRSRRRARAELPAVRLSTTAVKRPAHHMPGRAPRAAGSETLFAARRIPVVGDTALAVTRHLTSSVLAVSAIEIRIFHAASPQRAELPALGADELLACDAGLAYARIELTGVDSARIVALRVTGDTFQLRKQVGIYCGVFDWMWQTLQFELAALGVIQLEGQLANIPGSGISQEPMSGSDDWARERLQDHGVEVRPHDAQQLRVVFDRQMLFRPLA